MDTRPAVAPLSGPQTGGIPRSVLVVGITVIGLIALAAVIVLAAPVRPTTYAPGTPEAAFQALYTAWESRDLETAYGYLSEDVRAGMSLEEYRRLDRDMTYQRDEDRRVVLLGAEVDGERATLDIRVETFSRGMTGGDRYAWDRSVSLVSEGGAWHVDEGMLGVETVYYEAPAK